VAMQHCISGSTLEAPVLAGAPVHMRVQLQLLLAHDHPRKIGRPATTAHDDNTSRERGTRQRSQQGASAQPADTNTHWKFFSVRALCRRLHSSI